MKKFGFLVAALAVAALVAGPALASDSWTGWITEQHCGAKGASADHKDCAEKCHKGGSPYMFYNSADKKLYSIDNQDLAGQHLGHEVKVTGKVSGDAITVESIQPSAVGK
ncbi:MAG: DUF5818 domain-containing protein [Thermoanaerobaculia bacterium]